MEPTYTGRREDRRLVTGAGMYAADWDRPHQLHAAFLRADRAHARIVSMRRNSGTSRARCARDPDRGRHAVSGLYAVACR